MATYNSPSDLPSRVRGPIQRLVRDDERFVMAARSPGLLKRWLPYFVVTDQRLIRYRKSGLSEEIDETSFAGITNTSFKGTRAGGKVTLEGAGVHESYSVGGEAARALADAIRDELSRTDQARPA